MNFYVVTNGYTGGSYCRVYVAAENELRAKELASEVFKRHAKSAGADASLYSDIAHIEVVHCLSGDTEGAIDVVED